MTKKELLELLEGLPEDTHIVTHDSSHPEAYGSLSFYPHLNVVENKLVLFTQNYTFNKELWAAYRKGK